MLKKLTFYIIIIHIIEKVVIKNASFFQFIDQPHIINFFIIKTFLNKKFYLYIFYAIVTASAIFV